MFSEISQYDAMTIWTMIIALATVTNLLVAILMWAITFQSIRISKRNLELMERKEIRFHAKWDFQRMETELIKIDKVKIRLYVIALKISNMSDSPNAIIDIKLNIGTKYQPDLLSNILVPPLRKDSLEFSNKISKFNYSQIELPKTFNPHEVLEGLLLFQIADQSLANAEIDSYNLLFKDTHGSELSAEIAMFT